MPGRATSFCRLCCASHPTPHSSEPSANPSASSRMAWARRLMMPSFPMASTASSLAKAEGSGNTVSSPSKGVSQGMPNRCASLPASVLAALTVICWPMIARTDISNPPKLQGRRIPRSGTVPPPAGGSRKARCTPRREAQSVSKSRRALAASARRAARGSPTRRANCGFSPGRLRRSPSRCRPRRCMCARSGSASTVSTPWMARNARKSMSRSRR